MKWSEEAGQAVSKVPFFVKKRVKKKVEEEAARSGAKIVTPEHVRNSQKKFLNNMEDEIKGYRIETCFGSGGCPNRISQDNDLVQKIEEKLSDRDLKIFLKEYINGPVRMHHEFRVSISDCPNACSRPQIVNFGVMGACRPMVSEELCTQCQACLDACAEHAISFTDESETPIIDMEKCLACGKCIKACPTGTLAEEARGYRVLVDGKLGRHPRLGRELEGIFSAEEVLALVDQYLDFFQMSHIKDSRFERGLAQKDFDDILKEASRTGRYGHDSLPAGDPHLENKA